MKSMPFKLPATLALAGALSLPLMACTPTLKVKVELAPIYAKLDVNVRVQLDKEVKDLATKNPDLF